MKNKKNQTLPFFVFFFFCVITMNLYAGESTQKTGQSSLQAQFKILNKPKKPASLARQKEPSPLKNRYSSVCKNEKFIIKAHPSNSKEIINQKKNIKEINRNTIKSPEDNNKSGKEKIMQWFFERGIYPGDPESIKNQLEKEKKEKIFNTFKLKDPFIIDKKEISPLLARRKNTAFSIQLIKVECFADKEEPLNPE